MTTKIKPRPCICAEVEHPKQVKRNRLEREHEKRICHRMERKFKRLFDGLITVRGNER